MTSFGLNEINILEGEQEVDEFAHYEAIQKAINSGMWSLQGSYGRTMMDALKSGHCLLGRAPAQDYWGNRIPSRTEVQTNTKGSFGFVVQSMGRSWAQRMANVK